MSEKTDNKPEYGETEEKIRALYSNPEFNDFLDEYWGVRKHYIFEDEFKLHGFHIDKNVKNLTTKNGKKIFLPWNTVCNLKICEFQKRFDDDNLDGSNLFRMQFELNRAKWALQSDENSTVMASNINAPIEIDGEILPKILGGFVKGMANTKKYNVNGERINRLSSVRADSEDYLDNLSKLTGIIGNISGNETEYTKTPVLMSMDGVGMQVTHISDEYGTQTQIDLATPNPLGIMLYQLKIHGPSYNREASHISISRQAIDGSVEEMDKAAIANGYPPSIVHPIRDIEDFEKAIQKFDKYICVFMHDAQIT